MSLVRSGPDTFCSSMKIIRAHTETHLAEVAALFLEYEAFLGADISFQSFEEEVAILPGKYALPDGALLLAVAGQRTAGCGALRKLAEGIGEMKRLFVRPPFRGLGYGKALAKRLVDEAIRLGYSTMVLDTLDKLTVATAIYELLGFEQTAPYYQNPLPGVTYWKLDLTRPIDT
jgi:putative acetyltransferase